MEQHIDIIIDYDGLDIKKSKITTTHGQSYMYYRVTICFAL